MRLWFLTHKPWPLFTKNVKSDRNRKHILRAKMRFTKNVYPV